MLSPQRKALALSFFTVGYNVIEGVVSITAATLSGSSALFSFGLDSVVESLSGSVMIWRFWKHGTDLHDDATAAAEHVATRLVAGTFFLFGAYVVFDAGGTLLRRESPDVSVLGIVIAAVSLVVMPALFWAKYTLGSAIGSRSLVADSKETLACSLLSLVLLVGLVAFYWWRIWWIDAVAALVIALLMFKEGYELLFEEHEDTSPE